MIIRLALLFALLPLAANLQADEYQASDITQVVLLGVGNPNPVPERSGPATAIIVNGTSYIIDFGPGVMRRAALAARDKNIPALEAKNIGHAFLTHLHWDHSAGFPDLLLTSWTLGRKVPFQLVGPPGTRALADNIVQAYAEDIRFRVEGLEPANNQGWRVVTSEAMSGVAYRDDNVKVEVFPVCHGGWDTAVGYRFTTPDRVIVISGDTSYCPIIARMAKGADILIHEVYSSASHKRLPADWSSYHASSHTSSLDLARIANEARPRLLVLHHQLVWNEDSYELPLQEVSARYDGAVVSGQDLDVF